MTDEEIKEMISDLEDKNDEYGNFVTHESVIFELANQIEDQARTDERENIKQNQIKGVLTMPQENRYEIEAFLHLFWGVGETMNLVRELKSKKVIR